MSESVEHAISSLFNNGNNKNEIVKIYVSPSIFDTWAKYQCTSGLCCVDNYAPYKILKHCDDILNINGDTYFASDCIVNINKIISIRINDLNKIYHFDKMPCNIRLWEKLERLGIIRKFLVKEINNIRNSLMHENKEPPSNEVCRYYTEAVWYFLKATDLISTRIIEDATYDDVESNAEIAISIKFENDWDIELYGRLKQNHYYSSYSENLMEILCSECEEQSDGIYINGKIKGENKESILNIYRDYFALMF